MCTTSSRSHTKICSIVSVTPLRSAIFDSNVAMRFSENTSWSWRCSSPRSVPSRSFSSQTGAGATTGSTGAAATVASLAPLEVVGLPAGALVDADNTAAVGLYSALGFRTVHAEQAFVRADTASRPTTPATAQEYR